MQITEERVKAGLKRALKAGKITREEAKAKMERFRASQGSAAPAPQPTQQAAPMPPQQQAPTVETINQGAIDPNTPTLEQAQNPQAPQNPMDKMGFWEGLKEQFTGAARSTPEVEKVKTWEDMPEYSEFFSMPTFKTALGTMFTGGDEEYKVIAKNAGLDINDPEQVKQDEKGNWFFKSPKSGEWFAQKPGFRATDIPGALGAVAMGAASATSGGLLPAALMAAGTEAGIEASQAATGGDFSVENVALAGAMGSAGELGSRGLAKLGRGVKEMFTPEVNPNFQAAVNKARELLDDPASADELAQLARVNPEAVQQAQTMGAAAPAIEGPTDIGTLAAQATTSDKAKKELAQKAMINRGEKSAMEREGIKSLPVEIYSDSPEFVAASAVPRKTSDLEQGKFIDKLNDASNEINQAFEKYGANMADGTASTASVSNKVLDSMTAARDKAKSSAVEVFEAVKEGVPKSTRVTTPRMSAIADEIEGNIEEELVTPAIKKLIKLGQKEDVSYESLLWMKEGVRKTLEGTSDSFAGLPVQRLRELDEALKADQIDTVAARMGADMGEALKTANINYAKSADATKTIMKMFGDETTGSIGNKLKTALKNAGDDDRQINALLEQIPEDLHGEVLMTGINRLSRSASAQSGIQGGFGFNEFTKLYSSLRSNPKFTKKLADSAGPEAINMLNDLYKVSKRVNKVRSMVKGTGSDVSPMLKEIKEQMQAENLISSVIASPAGKLVATGGASAIPKVGKGLGKGVESAAGIFSTGGEKKIEAVGKLLRDDDFLKLVDEVSVGDLNTATIKRLTYAKPFRRFARAAGLPKQPSAQEKWIRTAITQGAIRSENSEN